MCQAASRNRKDLWPGWPFLATHNPFLPWLYHCLQLTYWNTNKQILSYKILCCSCFCYITIIHVAQILLNLLSWWLYFDTGQEEFLLSVMPFFLFIAFSMICRTSSHVWGPCIFGYRLLHLAKMSLADILFSELENPVQNWRGHTQEAILITHKQVY